jgi:hypothetical protein
MSTEQLFEHTDCAGPRWRSKHLPEDFCCPAAAALALDAEIDRMDEVIEKDVRKKIGAALLDRRDEALAEASKHSAAADLLARLGHAAQRGDLG